MTISRSGSDSIVTGKTATTFAADITALHQQIREFAEKTYPEYRVWQIKGETRTDYQPSQDLDTLNEMILTFVDMLFRVEMRKPSEFVEFKILVDSTGTFHIVDVSISRLYPRGKRP